MVFGETQQLLMHPMDVPAGISDLNQSLLNSEVKGFERGVGDTLTPDVQYSMQVLGVPFDSNIGN